MKILVVSLKGGVGKSSIALNLATYLNTAYVTNDLVTSRNNNALQIPRNTKRIPALYTNAKNIVFDFGAMSTNIDPKVSQAVELCDVAVIPTLTDFRSLKATVETYNLIKPTGKPIVIIINNFSKAIKYDEAYNYLINHLNRPRIQTIRTTTLFERIARDGIDWFHSIMHDKGQYQLNKTRAAHELVYDLIMKVGVENDNSHYC